MATSSTAVLDCLEKGSVPKSKRKLQKHLRSAGLAYISRTGKIIPAKKVAGHSVYWEGNDGLVTRARVAIFTTDELCQCPHKCDSSVPAEARQHLFNHFYGLSDADMQNQFLRQHMDLRARLNVPETTGTGRPPRRITCKYLIPLLPSENTVEVCQKAFVSAFVITTKRVRLQREKLISSLGLNVYSSHNRSKNSNNNNNIHTFNNNITRDLESKRNDLLNLVPSKLDFPLPLTTEAMAIDLTVGEKNGNSSLDKSNKNGRLTDNPLIPMGLLLPEGVTIVPVTASADHIRDIAIVNNFFSNQLWKPEYIGAHS